jgi:hypothetical protein
MTLNRHGKHRGVPVLTPDRAIPCPGVLWLQPLNSLEKGGCVRLREFIILLGAYSPVPTR